MKPPGGPDAFDDWIGIDEAAAYLAIPVRTLYLHAQQGRLPATKVGRTWRFKRSRLDEHLARADGDDPDRADTRQLERLVAEQGGLLSELAGLADMSVRLSALSEADEIMTFVSQRLYDIFAVDQAGFMRLVGPPGAQVLTTPVGAGTLAVPPDIRLPIDASAILRHVVTERMPVVLDDVPAQVTVAQDLIAALGVKAGVVAPVMDADQVWGLLVVITTTPRRFSALEVERIMAVAAQAGTAITNARLMAEARRWAMQLEGIEALSRQLNRSRKVAGVGEAVARELAGLMPYDGLRFYALEPDGQTLEPVTLKTNVPEYANETRDSARLQLGEGLGGQIALSGEAEIIGHVMADARTADIPGTPDVDESMLVVPLRFEGEVQGVLEISRLGFDAFEPGELRLAQILGAQAAVAIVNARQVEELQRRSDRLERQLANQHQLLAITERLLKTRDHDQTLAAMADTLAEVVPHDTLTIYLIDKAAGELVPVLARDQYADQVLQAKLALGEGITGSVVMRGEAEMINDANNDPRVRHVPGTPQDEEESIIVAPLHSPGGVIGALNLYRVHGTFEAEELDLVKLFANHAAIAFENAQVHQRLLVAAQTDPLTGLGHHGAFQETLAASFATDASLSVLMVDLDDFKTYNDRYGHQAGDRLLRRVADGLQASVRASDSVFRYGGDEFAVVLPGTDAAGAEVVAQKILAGLSAIPAVPGRQRRARAFVRASVGVASHPGDARDPHDLVAVADTALYVAKEMGKGRVVPASALPAHLQEMRALLDRVMNEPMPRLANGAPDLVRLVQPLHD
ncbi:MAG TPA: diguanylate cyclase, partial [Candidatus Sulfotelmatobacter sp.]|nr:diguanylate cyclase [Candidatus Sulfotelmatobacter sp.]